MNPSSFQTDSQISVILPAFNEEGVIESTIRRIEESAQTSPLLSRLQIVVVSDGSSDATFDEAVTALRRSFDAVVVELASNAGSHSAIRCGLRYATGERIVVMAADGQDPPEVLPDIVAAFRPGIDVVWGQRLGRDHDTRRARMLANTYYWMFRKLTGLDYPPAGFDFVAISRRVAEALLQYKERNTSIFLLIFNLGFGQTSIQYQRGERTGGESGWTFRKRLKLSVDMLTGFSAAPIRLVSAVGVIVGLMGLVFGGITLIRGIMGDIPVSGWASLMVISSLMGGLMLVAVGLLGEYVWRTLEEARGRPLYLESRHSVVESDPARRNTGDE